MKRALVISAIFAMLVGVASLAATMGGGTVRGEEPTPTPPPECLVPADLDVVIIIDRSGSMLLETGGKTRMQWAQEASVALVDGMAGGPTSHSLFPHHVEVLTFNGASPVTVVTPFSDDADAVRAAINGITNPASQTDTYIAPGMTRATSDLNSHVHVGSGHGSYKAVVLLSDGRNYANGDPVSGTDCPNTHARRANTVAAIPGLQAAADTIYTIGLGDETTCGSAHDELCDPLSCDPNDLDHYLLVDIAEGPPGDYTNVEDAADLPDIYADISQEVVNICVSFSGHKYDDPDCDGPNGDSPLAGIDIVLLQDSAEIDRKTTDLTGAYVFVNELPGTYLICEDLTSTDRVQTYPTSGSGTVSHPPYGVCYERTLTTPGGSENGLDFYNCIPPTPTPTPTPTFTATPTKTSTPTPTKTPNGQQGVGGVVRLPPAAVAAEAGAASEGSGWPVESYAALAGAVVAIGAGGWYARRRWLR